MTRKEFDIIPQTLRLIEEALHIQPQDTREEKIIKKESILCIEHLLNFITVLEAYSFTKKIKTKEK
ncbi:MAG: hypothetical protein IJ180_08975 [Bacteroidales bacterium]|nr:hypothetical protein [Bacteroidales bacterium]